MLFDTHAVFPWLPLSLLSLSGNRRSGFPNHHPQVPKAYEVIKKGSVCVLSSVDPHRRRFSRVVW